MFRRKKLISASSNLKRGLHLVTKIKSNECLDIRMEEVLYLFSNIGFHQINHEN